MKIAPRLCIALVLAGIASGQTKPKDVYGWSKVKWGMTIADAKAAFGDQASDATGRGEAQRERHDLIHRRR